MVAIATRLLALWLSMLGGDRTDLPTVVEAEVIADRVEVFSQPKEAAYPVNEVRRGDVVTVLPDRVREQGWLTISPPPTSFCWVEEASLDLDRDGAFEPDLDEAGGSKSEMIPAATRSAAHGWVKAPGAVARFGHHSARLPGPPAGSLAEGTMVQLVDRPAVTAGSGPHARRWLAIVPPPEQVCYINAAAVRWKAPAVPGSPTAEVRASFEEPEAARKPGEAMRSTSGQGAADLAAELDRLDSMYRAILASQVPSQWRFETVRSAYQALLRRVGQQRGIEETIREKLAHVTRSEQAAQAARTIEAILARSHRRDHEVAGIRQELARVEQVRSRAYDAVGFIQPSARKVDGHAVYVLIGRDGTTTAYLDVPPGLNPEPLLARRVGVRGQSHFNEDLGSRLITVRDMEGLGARK